MGGPPSVGKVILIFEGGLPLLFRTLSQLSEDVRYANNHMGTKFQPCAIHR